MALTGNKGEWSEAYTFFKLLATGQMDVADEELNAVPGEFYKILEILRTEAKSENRYIRHDDNISIIVARPEEAPLEFSISVEKFANNAAKLLQHLKVGKGRSLQFPDIEDFMTEIQMFSVKDRTHKRDITIRIEDFHCGLAHTLGFSIKSFLGKDSTLFNAGAGTNFIYEICLPEGVSLDVDQFNAETYQSQKIAQRITRLENEYGASLIFRGTQSDTLLQNLMMIDGLLPDVLSALLLTRYRCGISSVKDCIERLSLENPLKVDIKRYNHFYEYKVKRFLQDVAMGMTPETVWSGRYDATGGQIIVKESGDIVCYHIYELNRFMDFLLNTTRFEQPATSEDANNPGHIDPQAKKPFKYGWVYKENGKLYIKINLQIRFK